MLFCSLCVEQRDNVRDDTVHYDALFVGKRQTPRRNPLRRRRVALAEQQIVAGHVQYAAQLDNGFQRRPGDAPLDNRNELRREVKLFGKLLLRKPRRLAGQLDAAADLNVDIFFGSDDTFPFRSSNSTSLIAMSLDFNGATCL